MSLPSTFFVFRTPDGGSSPYIFFDSLDRVNGSSVTTDTVSGQTWSGTHGVGNGGLSAGPINNLDVYNSSDLVLATNSIYSSRRNTISSTANYFPGANYFIAPEDGYYEFNFRGASGGVGGGAGNSAFGGGYAGGSGVVGTGIRWVTAGTEVGVVVGKVGATGKGNGNTNGAGGGGTFVFQRQGTGGANLWFAAGGGGGGVGTSHQTKSSSYTLNPHASTGNSGRVANGSSPGAAGTSGGGGGRANGGSNYDGSGGAGWVGNGVSGSNAAPAQAINQTNGTYAAMGGMKYGGQYLFDGGYGGGGATGDTRTDYSHGGGGGGGYSGGGGSWYDGSPGGGGSYYDASNTFHIGLNAFKNYGNGSVCVTYLGTTIPSGYGTSVAGKKNLVLGSMADFKAASLAMGATDFATSGMTNLQDATNNNGFAGSKPNLGFYAYNDSTSFNVESYGVQTVYVETPATQPSGGVWGGRYAMSSSADQLNSTYGGGGFFTVDSRILNTATAMIGLNNAGVFQIRSAGGMINEFPASVMTSGLTSTQSYGQYNGMLMTEIARYN